MRAFSPMVTRCRSPSFVPGSGFRAARSTTSQRRPRQSWTNGFVAPIKSMIEEKPLVWLSHGSPTCWGSTRTRYSASSRIKGWQVRKRPTGARPRIEALPSVAEKPNERWSTDLARVWGGKDGWCTLALVMDCHTRELLGWHLSRSGKATTAASALEHALIARFGTLGKVDEPFLLRSDNGLVFTSRKYTALGQKLRTAPGVHHATLSPAERHDGAPDPVLERAMRPSPALRKPGSCNPCYWRLDPVLQP